MSPPRVFVLAATRPRRNSLRTAPGLPVRRSMMYEAQPASRLTVVSGEPAVAEAAWAVAEANVAPSGLWASPPRVDAENSP